MYYAILTYIIIIVLLVIIKPDFIYDHNNNQYREFGNDPPKTLFTLPVIAILLSIIIVIIFSFSYIGSKQEMKQVEQIRYIPVPYFQPNVQPFTMIPT